MTDDRVKQSIGSHGSDNYPSIVEISIMAVCWLPIKWQFSTFSGLLQHLYTDSKDFRREI